MTHGPATTQIPPPLPDSISARPESSQTATPSLEDVFTGKNLFRLGLGLLLLGLVFLFRHAIEEQWIGPAARVGAGVVTGLALIGTGLRIDRRRPTFGQLLQGGGVAGLYLSAFAAHRVYEMIDVTSAFVQLVMIAGIGVALAVRSRAESLAAVSIVGALAAPLLLAGRMIAFGGDALYIAVVLAASAFLFLRFEWSRMWWITQGGTALLLAADLLRYQFELASTPTGLELQLVLGAAWLFFYLVPLAAYASGRLTDSTPAFVGSGLSLGIYGASYLVWTSQVSDLRLAGAAAILAALHLVVRGVLKSRTGELAEFQLVPAAVLAMVATVLAFEGPVLMLLLAAESVSVVFAGRKVARPAIEYIGHSGFALVAMTELVRMAADGPTGTPMLNGSALARLGVIGLAAALAVLFDRLGDESSLRTVYAVFSVLSVLALLFVELTPVSQAAVTVGWGAIGVGLTGLGHVVNRRDIRLGGIGVILAGVAKLFIVDLASAEPIWRIALFAGFGVVLLVMGYWMSNDE